MKLGSWSLLSFIILLQTQIGRTEPAALPTVAGPEASGLIESTTGYIVYTDLKTLHVLKLPQLKETIINDPSMNDGITVNIGQMGPSIDAVSGPDHEGHIVYIEGKGKHQSLKVTNLDGSLHEIIFSRMGEPLLEGISNRALSLAHTSSLVAVFGQSKGIQMRNPDAYLFQGPAEIWSLSKKEKVIADENAIQYGGLCWFPDGSRLAYVKLIPRDQAPVPTSEGDNFGIDFKHWDRVPVVFIYDLSTHESKPLLMGWHPVVSNDGASVVVFDYDDKARWIDLEKKQSRPFDWRGHWHGIISFTTPTRIIYLGLPTAGSVPRWTEHYSPLVGPKQLISVKVLDLSNGDFETVVPYFDWRHGISYGD